MSPLNYSDPDFKNFLYWGLNKYDLGCTQGIYNTLDIYGLDQLTECEKKTLEEIYDLWLNSDFEELLLESRYPEGLIGVE